MKFKNSILYMSQCNQIIKNINFPSCKNCIYYKPDSFYSDFTSPLNKCEKFGEKNIITDEIKYNYVDFCRNDETLCGKEGKYFEEEKNIKFKIMKYKIFNILPYSFPVILLVASLFIKALFGK